MARRLETASRFLAVTMLLGVALLPSIVSADTVYLKNGRTLQATHVEVLEDEGKVVLQQAGNRIVIPLSIVDRIEEDDERSEVLDRDAEPVRPELEAEAAEPQAEDGESEEGEGEEGETAEDDGEEVPSEQTREYWQQAVKAIREERTLLEERLEELRREERAFLFSHRSTAETKRQIEQVETRLEELDVEMQELRTEARRKGIPPGWLRVDG